MKLAESMKNITDNIVAAHHVRVKALGNLISEVNDSLDKFASDRKAMGKEQAAELARFTGEIASAVGAQLKGFHKELELVAKERVLSAKELKARLHKEAKDLSNLVAKSLNNYHKAHADMSEAQRHRLQGFVKDIVNLVTKTLNNYHQAHADMSKAQRHKLQGFVKDIVKTVGDMNRATQGLMGDYRADIRKAGAAWSDMTRTLAKARAQQDESPIVEGGETTDTVEGAVHKIHRRRRKKSKK